MAPEPQRSGGQVVEVTPGDLQRAAYKIGVEGSSVAQAPDATCVIPAMPHSQSDGEMPHIVEAVNNSKRIVAGRLQVISEAIATAATAFATTEEQSAHNLAAIGDFNTPLPRR